MGRIQFILSILFLPLLASGESALGPTFYKTLEQNYFAPVPFGYNHAASTEAINAFFQFLTLPKEKTDQFKAKLSAKHRRGDLGLTYRHKTNGDDYSDKKCFFHYHPILLKKYKSEIDKDPIVRVFFTHADKIWHEVRAKLKIVLKELEPQHPGIYKKVLDTQKPHIVLRFLRYGIQTPGKLLAKPHFDAGAMTFAIAESKPGLRIGSCPSDLKLVQHQDGKALFFLAGSISGLTDPKTLKPGWHDVVQVGKKSSNNHYERWAIVAFIDGHDVEGAPESLTHKWRVSSKLL